MKLVFAHDHVFYKHNNTFYSTGGLSHKILQRYSSNFEEVTVISRQREIENLDRNLTLASVDQIQFVKVPNYKSLSSLKHYNKAHSIIENEVKKADAVIARLPSSIGAATVKYAKKHKKPYLIEVVACPWDEMWNHSLIGKLVAPWNYLNTRYLVKHSQYTIYVTNEFLQRRYPTRGSSINCSNVSLQEFDDSILKRRLERIEQMDKKQKIVIGTTASVNVRYKGQQYIIEALGELKKHGHTNYVYQLVGGGDSTFLKNIAKKNNVENQVEFLGSMPHDEVFNWLDAIDFYVQPSRQEGLPRALIEAMSRGVPAFGAKTAGIPELLREKYIFSNSKKNKKEIIEIVFGFTMTAMIKAAEHNYLKSKQYQKRVIEDRRNDYFQKFKKDYDY